MGKIKLNDMRFFGYHGVSEAEKKIGKNFDISLEMEYNTSKASEHDDLQYTIDYEALYKTIEGFIAGERYHLLETLAERLADNLMEKYNIDALTLSVAKVAPPFPGTLNSIEIEVTRKRT